jgi:hypothetical protein
MTLAFVKSRQPLPASRELSWNKKLFNPRLDSHPTNSNAHLLSWQVKFLSCNQPQHVVRLFADARIQVLQLQSVCRKHSPLRQVFDSISPLGVGRFASRGMILAVSNGQSTSAKTALRPARDARLLRVSTYRRRELLFCSALIESTSTPADCGWLMWTEMINAAGRITRSAISTVSVFVTTIQASR